MNLLSSRILILIDQILISALTLLRPTTWEGTHLVQVLFHELLAFIRYPSMYESIISPSSSLPIQSHKRDSGTHDAKFILGFPSYISTFHRDIVLTYQVQAHHGVADRLPWTRHHFRASCILANPSEHRIGKHKGYRALQPYSSAII